MEKEPKKPKGFRITIEGKEVYCEPNNVVAYIHPKDQEQYDHLFYITEYDEENETVRGARIWRREIKNFDELLKFMIDNNFDLELQEPDEQDVEAYHETFRELKRHELTERQERFVTYFRYLLDHENIAIEDFVEAEGELSI